MNEIENWSKIGQTAMTLLFTEVPFCSKIHQKELALIEGKIFLDANERGIFSLYG